ncbi:hypothetical protein PRUB_a0263 [Pseudoalteromonas rubra]|uniref:Uncharacterized protein n=1 Tax=Pseudoalteromonas rubra TaxID=43658 RepID=A0A8T0C7A5_9GAMM|nr:hypothetical protein PRUB_a0263 [Pseudoalteromonas rubra]
MRAIGLQSTQAVKSTSSRRQLSCLVKEQNAAKTKAQPKAQPDL